jgi:hypothetical protein
VPSPESKEIENLYRWYRSTVDEMIRQSEATNVPLSMADFWKLSFFTLTREPSNVR